MFALLISTVYGLIMMAVLVGILIEIQEDGPLAPSTLFLFIVAGEIIIAGLIHPQEVYCLPSGTIYYVTIPSMYLLLIIYSVCNLNVVSWGTRETVEEKVETVILAKLIYFSYKIFFYRKKNAKNEKRWKRKNKITRY